MKKWRNDFAIMIYNELVAGIVCPIKEWLYIFYLQEEAPELYELFMGVKVK